MTTGWECPTCHRCYSPDVSACAWCPPYVVTTNIAGCTHTWRLNGICAFCGHCNHLILLDGVCVSCKNRPPAPFVAYVPQAGCG